MHWIALSPPEPELALWSWRALQFTPRVARLEEALLLEISVSQRLWRGPARLLRLLLRARERSHAAVPPHGQGSSSLLALARLRLQQAGEITAAAADDLPLWTLSAARVHLDTLERVGCRNWGQLRALPRGGVARRFGAPLLQALDEAYGERPESHGWLTLPEGFDMKLELPATASSAPELMWTAQRLLQLLQAWLRARQLGVLALELEWTLDWRRLDGAPLPGQQRLQLRTAQPTQNMGHLRRLVTEQLARVTLAAPASQLRLRSLDTAPWGGASTCLLPEEQVQGERLHELLERLTARLGPQQVRRVLPLADHRPERMQRWLPAREPDPPYPLPGDSPAPDPREAFYPTWLLEQPLRLEVQHDQPQHGGPLRRLLRLYRIEAGWWEGQGPVLRDYFLAHSTLAGLVWIYRERPLDRRQAMGQARWFLQGFYA